jgi:alpha-tubulin suppressor-like RCC1 family protein
MAKQRKALSKTFVHRAVILSTLLMALLCVLGLLYLQRRPALLAERAKAASDAGDYEKAVALLNQLEKSEETEAQLLKARYDAADRLLSEGKYKEAETAFSTLGEYADARTKILACRYGLADQAAQAGDYAAAKEQFYALSGYSDALIRYNEARYAIAVATEATDPNQAFDLFYELIGFSDAQAQAERIAMQLTGMSNPENAVNRMLGVSEEEILQREKIAAAREALPQSVLAVGFYHTVGLKADGTVVAVGRNESGQLNVSEWTDIVAIACTDYDTLGLKADGTIVHTGYHAYSALTGWSDLASIAGGSYAAAAITQTGQMLSSHPSSRSESVRGAVAVDVSTGYAVVLSADGTVLMTEKDGAGEDGEAKLPWTDVVAVSAASTGVVGLKADGTVVTHWFRERDAVDCSDIVDAVAIAAGGTHTAVLKKDGTVITRGRNDQGECGTELWNLGSR